MWQCTPKGYRITAKLILSHHTGSAYHELTNALVCESWSIRRWRQGHLQVGITPTWGSSMFSASHHCVLAQEELPILSKKSGVSAVGGNTSSELLMTNSLHSLWALARVQLHLISYHRMETLGQLMHLCPQIMPGGNPPSQHPGKLLSCYKPWSICWNFWSGALAFLVLTTDASHASWQQTSHNWHQGTNCEVSNTAV